MPLIFLKPISGFQDYFASEHGRIYSTKSGTLKEKIGYVEKTGYITIGLIDNLGKENRYRIHRLIAASWLIQPDGKNLVNHIDGNKQNNIASNLEYVTAQENTIHAIQNGLITHYVRPVIQYSLNKEKIKEYPSIKAAYEETGVSCDGIQAACKDKQRTAGGYIWIYAENKLDPRSHGNAKTVLQYNKNWAFIKEYKSLRDAATATKTDLMGICNTCNGKQKSSGGFYWKYKNIGSTMNTELAVKQLAALAQVTRLEIYRLLVVAGEHGT